MKSSPTNILIPFLFLFPVFLWAGCSDDDPVVASPDLNVGTITIDIMPDTLEAQWTCTPLGGEMITGRRCTTLVNMPEGSYSLMWEELWERISPETETRDLAAGDTLAFVGIYGPKIPTHITTGYFFGVLGTASDDVVAVGDDGALIHFDGTAWTRIDLGTTASIRALAGNSSADLWACGNGGEVWRRAGLNWEAAGAGLVENQLALGYYQGVLHVGSLEGSLHRYEGGAWQAVDSTIIIRDRESEAPVDTLMIPQDLAAITTIGHFGIGGAYILPDYDGEPIGIIGTQGMILGDDPEFDWRLDPIEMTGPGLAEWVTCSTSDDADPGYNYMGTSTGGLFRLVDEGSGKLRWLRQPLEIPNEPDGNITDIWLGPDGDLYLVTYGGQVVYLAEGEAPRVIYTGTTTLAGIWGTDPSDIWVVGLWENKILHVAHNPVMGLVLADLRNVPGALERH